MFSGPISFGLLRAIPEKNVWEGWKALFINNILVMDIRATFHIVMHYGSQLQLFGAGAETNCLPPPTPPFIFFSGIALICTHAQCLMDVFY